MAMKRNEVLAYATTRMNLENKEARYKKLLHVCFHVYEMSRIGKFIDRNISGY